MPRRAAISVLIFLAGLGTVAAGTIDLTRRNAKFQPGAMPVTVVQPRSASVAAATALRPLVAVQKITPILQAPGKVKIGRAALSQPRDAIVQTPAVKAAARH